MDSLCLPRPKKYNRGIFVRQNFYDDIYSIEIKQQSVNSLTVVCKDSL